MNPIYQFLKENNLTTKDEKTFEKDYSDSAKAKELYGFFQENKLTEKDFNSFYDTYLKKKEPSQVVLPTGGKAGTSEVLSGFEGLKPAKVQPIEVKEPKVSGEDTALARRIQRQQQQAIESTGVKLPATPKVVAEEKAAARAAEPKLPASTIQEGQSYISNVVSALDRGFYSNLVENPIRGLATVIQQGTSAMTGGRVKEGPVSDLLNTIADKFGNAIREVTPQDKEFQGSLSDQFAQALGQVGALVVTGGAGAGGRAATLAEQAIPKAVTAVPKTLAGKVAAKAAPTAEGIKKLAKEIASPASVSAGLTVGQAEFDRAKEKGASDQQAFEAFYKNAAVGSILEKIPVMQFLNRFNKATSGGVVNYLKTKGVSGVTGGLEEATTEVLQQLYANKTAQDIYNINQNVFEGITESGGIGFGVGFLLNAMGAQAKLLRQQGKEEEAQTLENQEQEFKAKAEGVPPAGEIPKEITELKDDESVVFNVKTIEEIPEEFRDRAVKKEGITAEVRKKILGLPIGKKSNIKLGEGFSYTLTGKEAKDYASKQAAPQVPAAPENVEKIEIPRYFTFGELGGGKGKSGKALSSVEADRNEEIAQDLKRQLQEGDKLIEPNGTVSYFRNGKVVKEDGSPYGMIDIPAFVNGVTIERSKAVVGEEVAPQVPAAPEKAEIVSIDEKETIRQMKPFTDEMANIEREFENRGLKIDTDYDNEIIVTDRKGNILDPEEIPSDIANLAAAYEQATMKLGEFDQVAREKALAESRKVEEVVGEEVAAPEVPAAPAEEELPFGETAPREVKETKQETNLKKRALNLEIVDDPRGEVLQYFISGGKINPRALEELFGKERRMGMGKIRVEERRSRTALTNSSAPSIEELAEKIAGVDRTERMQDYRNAIEEALLNHSGTATMAEELVNDYDIDFAEQKRMAELEDMGRDIEIETQNFLSQVPEAQKEEMLRVLDRFRDEQGFVDWRAMDEELKFGFEPVLLELSPESQKIIENAINQIKEGGRISGVPAEAITSAEEVRGPEKTLKPEEYVQEQAAGQVPIQPEAGVSEEVEGGVPPTEPPRPPKEGETEGEKEGMTGISNEEALKVRFDIGLPVFEKPQPESWNQLNEEADKKIREGYNVEKLLEKLERGVPPTSVEEVILAKYAATLADTFEKTRSEDVLREYERVTNITNSIGTLTARALNVRKLLVPKEDTLADFFVIEKEETGVDELTDEQKAVITKEYEEIKATAEALQKKVEQLQEEVAKKRAGEVVAQETKKVKKTKKTDQDFSEERKQIVEDIREKLKKARQESKVTFVPYANELIAISPDVAKLVKSLVEQGVIKLEDVVTEVYNTIKPEINDLTRKDVTDLIAGEYNKKKPTRGDIAAKVQDLRTEIKLINQLEALERGEIPKSPQKKIERNRELKKLRDRIKEHPTTKAADAKKRITTQIEKLEKDLAEGNYDPKPEKREIPLDAEGKKLQKKLIELRKQRDIRRIKNEYDKRTKGQKALDKVLEIANVPRSLMASTDFSAPLNQAVIATIAYPDLSAKAVQQMVKATASQDAFDQWFYELKDDPRYDLMKELRLRISDPHSPFLTAKEEAFMGGYAEQIPGVGVLVKASERAYVQYLNKLRVDLFNRFVDRFEEQGKTYENNKKLYESTAKYINNITGSGKLPKIGSVDFEQFAPFFNALLFSPRLMASRINMLNPVYFGTLPTELKIQYAKDMGSTLGLGSLLLTLFALYGKSQDDDEEKITIETDPTSSDFARIKQGNVRWDIWGGMQPYVRLFAQIGSGERKSTRTGLKQSLDGEGAFGTTRGDVLSSFVRGKLSPIPAMAVNLAQGRNAAGEKVTLEKELFSHLLPLSMQSIGEAIKEEGPSKIVSAGLPAIFGIGLQVYGDRSKEVKKTIDYKNREIELNKEQINYFQDTYNELSKKSLEKLKKTPEYKSVDKATQVQLETQLQRLMMKKAEKKLTEKYRSEFLKAPVMTEDEKVERAKRMIKKKFD